MSLLFRSKVIKERRNKNFAHLVTIAMKACISQQKINCLMIFFLMMNQAHLKKVLRPKEVLGPNMGLS